MISAFPLFCPLTLDLKDEITSFTSDFEPVSDFSFVNLYSWNTDESAEISWLNNNLVIKLPDYLERGRYNYSIFGIQDIDDSLDQLFTITNRLELVPEIVINNIQEPDRFKVVEDRDNFDYIYKIDDIALLPGKKYKNKRNKIQQTYNKLPDRISIETVTTLNDELRTELMDVLRRWQMLTNQTMDKVELEGIALRRLFDSFSSFDLQITTIRIDGKLEGFSINEILNELYSICHFEKTITNVYDGIGAVVIKEAAKALFGKSAIVNWEQDLGIPGLKQAKQSYYPIKFQSKYWVKKLNDD